MQYSFLKKHLDQILQVDTYGLHTICSIYFDTDDYSLIRSSLEKPVYKEKLRLRSYGIPKGYTGHGFSGVKEKIQRCCL